MPDFRKGSQGSFASVSTPFEAGFLPDVEKERLCRSLLAEFGVTEVKVTHEGEMIHSCCLGLGGHKNGDATPSASLNYKKLTYNPVAGETLVKTYDGERPIKDLVGGRHLLLDGKGQWVWSDVIYSGVHPLLKVTLTRNGRQHVVYATAEHRWLISPKGSYQKGKNVGLVERTTATLKPKDRIPSVWPSKRTGRTTLSPVGVMAGFVFGDGTRTKHGARANFIGKKDAALLPYFAAFSISETSGGQTRQITNGLPRSWKDLPRLDEGASYLYGWLAGYFAADGCVADDGYTTLACANEATLRSVVTICERLGIATWGISGKEREGITGERSMLYTLSFRDSTLDEKFFLIPEHRQRWLEAQQRKRYARTHWWVTSVEPTDRVEAVYCAIVPTTHSFVIEGNILTGNCLGCGSSGGLLWFIATCRGEGSDDARRWLDDQTGSGPDEQSLGSLLEFFDAVYGDKQRQRAAPIPKMSKAVLTPWMAIHPHMTDPKSEGGRGISEESVMRFTVGYAPEYRLKVKAPDGQRGDKDGNVAVLSPRIVIPHFWKGDLVGWQTRRLVADGTPKYVSSPDFPKDTTIFNYDASRKVAVVVESPMSVLARADDVPYVEATFGAKVTDRQCSLLSIHPRIILWMDNDKAGWTATARLGEYLEPYCDVWVVDSPWNEDAGGLDSPEVLRLLEEALVPFALWTPPKSLTCWECKAPAHEGRCAT